MSDRDVRLGYRALMAGGLHQLSERELVELTQATWQARHLKRAPLYLPGPGDLVRFPGSRWELRRVVCLLIQHPNKRADLADMSKGIVTYANPKDPSSMRTMLVASWRAAARGREAQVLETGPRESWGGSGVIPTSVLEQWISEEWTTWAGAVTRESARG